MARHLITAKPVSEPMMAYCRLFPCEIELKYQEFHTRKWIWKFRLKNGGHVVSALMCYFLSSVAFKKFSIITNVLFAVRLWETQKSLSKILPTWWRHQMETFSALLAICAGNSPVPGEFPAQRPVTQSFGVFLDLRLNKRLNKQSRGLWFETLSRPLWRHGNDASCRRGATMVQWTNGHFCDFKSCHSHSFDELKMSFRDWVAPAMAAGWHAQW